MGYVNKMLINTITWYATYITFCQHSTPMLVISTLLWLCNFVNLSNKEFVLIGYYAQYFIVLIMTEAFRHELLTLMTYSVVINLSIAVIMKLKCIDFMFLAMLSMCNCLLLRYALPYFIVELLTSASVITLGISKALCVAKVQDESV